MRTLSLNQAGGGLRRLLYALALQVEQPAVIGTAQALLLRDAVEHVHGPVRTPLGGDPVFTGWSPVEHQILTEQAHGLGRSI